MVGFLFAAVSALVSPCPALTVVPWTSIARAGLWLAPLGSTTSTDLALVLRSGREIVGDHWRTIVDYP